MGTISLNIMDFQGKKEDVIREKSEHHRRGEHQSVFYNLKNALFSFAYFAQSSQIASLD